MLVEELQQARDSLLALSERDRGVDDVDPRHWHYKVYQRWLADKRPNPVPKLSACHYWRAVLLWAPGRWLQPKLKEAWWQLQHGAVGSRAAAITVSGALGFGAVWVSFVHPFWWVYILINFGALLGGMTYLALVYVLAGYIWQSAHGTLCVSDEQDMQRLPTWLRYLYFVVCGPTALVFDAVAWLCVQALKLIAWLREDVDVLSKTGRALRFILRWTVRVLNAPHRRLPWLRLWWALPVTGWVLAAAESNNTGHVDGRLLATTWSFTVVGMLFALVLSVAAAWHSLMQWMYNEKLRLLQTPGFVEWLRTGSQARQFNDNTPYGVRHDSSVTTMAQKLSWESITEWLVKYLRDTPVPAAWFVQFPESVQRRLGIVPAPDPNRWRRTKAAWAPISLFLAGTWALLALIWASIVYVERVSTCPLLRVKEITPPTTDTNELVTPQ
jgi:hypothetical protein